MPAFPFGELVCNEFDATGNLQSKVIVRDASSRCRPDGKWEVTARKIHECVAFPGSVVAGLLYDYKWVIDPDDDGCPSAIMDFTLTTTTIDPANILNTANCNEECWADVELLLAVA